MKTKSITNDWLHKMEDVISFRQVDDNKAEYGVKSVYSVDNVGQYKDRIIDKVSGLESENDIANTEGQKAKKVDDGVAVGEEAVETDAERVEEEEEEEEEEWWDEEKEREKENEKVKECDKEATKERSIENNNNNSKNILRDVHQEQLSPKSFSSRIVTIRDGVSKKLPQAIIIGVKKGGTRALLEFLRLHPDIRAPGPEPHFFDRHYTKGLEWYRNQMPVTIKGQITMEKTPSYFITRDVPRRIHSMSKDVKLIVVVRDPVTRAISDYTQTMTKRHTIRQFEQMAFVNNSTRIVDTSWGAIRIGVYAKHLQSWLKYFPLEQMHFVSGEKLISDPAGEMTLLQDFLGLKRVINEKHFFFNETKGFPCLKKVEGSGHPHCLGKTKGRQHPVIDSRVIQRLRDFYRPFNTKFYSMAKRNFEWP
eukprot:XP_014769153.1 PREDICTED: heparan sulfate glucosamine 3-O-sulfotransferase 6-like [Octopus bimaculoides]